MIRSIEVQDAIQIITDLKNGNRIINTFESVPGKNYQRSKTMMIGYDGVKVKMSMYLINDTAKIFHLKLSIKNSHKSLKMNGLNMSTAKEGKKSLRKYYL